MNKNYLFTLLLPFLFFINQRSDAQSTNPAPYCYPAAVNMTAGSCTAGSGFNLQSVKLKTLSQAGSCYGSSNTDVYRYWSSTTTLTTGGKYSMTIITPYNASGYSVSAGVWIDFNQNGSFEAAELIGADINKNNYSGTGGLYHYFTFTVPCSVATGKTRMRVRSQYNTKVSAADTCSCPGGYGETWDFDISIAQPGSLIAGFNMPSQAFLRTVVKVTLDNSNEYTLHDWDTNNDGVYESLNQPSNSNTTSNWTTPGTKCVKLRSHNCISKDSVVKCISIVAPTAVPVADFLSCNRTTEVYGSVNLTDLSSNGAYIWKWRVYDSVTFKNDPFDPVSDENSGYVVCTTNTSQNPKIDFYRQGNYTVELVASNGIGASTVVRKKFYIKVFPPTEYFLGFGAYGKNFDNRVEGNFGTIVDDGGYFGNYSNNQGVATRSYLAINPRALRPILLQFSQVRLKDVNDSIKIYDDDKDNNAKLLDVLTYSDNGTYPSYTSTLNKMYILFKSNGLGIDSGYIARYSNTGSFSSSKLNISIGHNILFPNKKSVFYDENQTEYSYSFDKIWSVNDTVQSAYNNMDTLVYKFKYTGSQKVCLEMRNCSDTLKQCKNLVFASGILGTAYKDNNSNCQYGTGDKAIMNIPVMLFDSTQNKWSYYVSDANGEFNFNKGAGGYKVKIDTLDMPYRVKCKSPGIDSAFRLTSSNLLKTIDFDIACKTGYDLGVRSVLTTGAVFPGRTHTLKVCAGDMNKWFGLNCTSGLSGTVVISVSGKVAYLNKASGSLTPSSVSGNVFTYTISNFSTVSNSTDFGLEFKTDTSAKFGDTISVSVTVTPSGGDYNTSNNTMNYRYLVRNSYDPNMKEVYPSEIIQGYNDWLTYTIHFQNTGNASAYDIRIADTLDSKLDLQTFQLTNYSHTLTTTLKDNALSFVFRDIMLPDSNSNEKASHGFVQYRIKPKTGLPKGSVIKNKAFIYFDYNDPVVTNTVDNEIFPKYVLIPDANFAAWLTAKYPGCMRKGNLMDTSCGDIKNETAVDVSGKNIASLFGIQFFKSLKTLNCSANLLIGLPQLPSGVADLSCTNNAMTSLPALPPALQSLLCGFNKLAQLPVLPGTITILHCENNMLSSLPLLPSGLNELQCGNNKITCFEKFSESLTSLDIAGNNNKCVPNYISAMDAATKSTLLCIKGDIVNNPDNCLTTLPALVFIPDANFAAWLNIVYPSCMVNGNWMDTSCNNIKNTTSINVASRNIADLFGIQFFTSLKTLNCSGNILNGLPALPVAITHVNCARNKISGLPLLPNSLQVLLCDHNSLTSLPVLPSILNYLNCSDNKIVSLPALPNTLENLYCDRNQLTVLQALPNVVRNLSCIKNAITSLPSLPGSLITMNCDSNKLTFLPDLPAGMNFLSCESNALTLLPVLPAGLKDLYCNDNKIICFDKFSEDISGLNISNNNYKCLPNYISAMDAATKSTALCIMGDKINNPDNCISTLQVSVRPISITDNLIVYPNPGAGLFNIEIPSSMKGEAMRIEVYDVLGELISTSASNSGKAQIDISAQPGGVYVVKLIGKDLRMSKCIIKE